MNSSIYKKLIRGLALTVVIAGPFISCQKFAQGFLSPYAQYPKSVYTIPKGQLYSSDAIAPDGSSGPLTITFFHAYDSAGRNVDSLFTKTYPVITWLEGYNPLLDTTQTLVAAKQKTVQQPAISINPASGAIQANYATLN